MAKQSLNEETLRAIGEKLEEVFAELLVQEAHQWTKPVHPSSQLAGTEEEIEQVAEGHVKQKNTISDPTGDTVVNDSRMNLRRVLVNTERELDLMLRNLNGISVRMHKAGKPWRGE